MAVASQDKNFGSRRSTAAMVATCPACKPVAVRCSGIERPTAFNSATDFRAGLYDCVGPSIKGRTTFDLREDNQRQFVFVASASRTDHSQTCASTRQSVTSGRGLTYRTQQATGLQTGDNAQNAGLRGEPGLLSGRVHTVPSPAYRHRPVRVPSVPIWRRWPSRVRFWNTRIIRGRRWRVNRRADIPTAMPAIHIAPLRPLALRLTHPRYRQSLTASILDKSIRNALGPSSRSLPASQATVSSTSVMLAPRQRRPAGRFPNRESAGDWASDGQVPAVPRLATIR